MVALQYLSPRERAALILCDTLGFTAAEAAAICETSVAAVTSGLQRARKTLPLRPAKVKGLHHDRDLLDQLTTAWNSNDVTTLVSLIAKDATLSMPPLDINLKGAEQIVAFFADGLNDSYSNGHLLACETNGQRAVASYARQADNDAFSLRGVIAPQMSDNQISRLIGFPTPVIVDRFVDLPMTINVPSVGAQSNS